MTQAQICASMFVLGPVLFAFVSWVLKQAREAGKRRLYFLSRDGWLMYLMARQLCRTEPGFPESGSSKADSSEADFPEANSAEPPPLECRYLYASRYAWRIPEQHLIGKRSLERICRGGMHVTFADMMKRAGLTGEEAERIAAFACPGQRADEVLSWSGIQRLKGPLSGCREFWELADERSRSRYGDTLGYLSQEGLLDDIPYALVDSGWIGTMQESLSHLLESAGYSRRVEGYYFGLYSLPRTADEKNFHGWYFEPASGTGRKAHFSNCLFECIFTAPHGMTMGYERAEGRWEPVLAGMHPENEAWVERQMRLFELYAQALSESLSKGRAGSLEEEAAALRVRGLLGSLMSAPSPEEGECFGSVSFSDDVTEERMRPLAARLTQRQLLGHHPLPRLYLTLLPGNGSLRTAAGSKGASVCTADACMAGTGRELFSINMPCMRGCGMVSGKDGRQLRE